MEYQITKGDYQLDRRNGGGRTQKMMLRTTAYPYIGDTLELRKVKETTETGVLYETTVFEIKGHHGSLSPKGYTGLRFLLLTVLKIYP